MVIRTRGAIHVNQDVWREGDAGLEHVRGLLQPRREDSGHPVPHGSNIKNTSPPTSPKNSCNQWKDRCFAPCTPPLTRSSPIQIPAPQSSGGLYASFSYVVSFQSPPDPKSVNPWCWYTYITPPNMTTPKTYTQHYTRNPKKPCLLFRRYYITHLPSHTSPPHGARRAEVRRAHPGAPPPAEVARPRGPAPGAAAPLAPER